jgi:hypothetical protein
MIIAQPHALPRRLASRQALPQKRQQLLELREALGPKLGAPFALDVAEDVENLRVDDMSTPGEADKSRGPRSSPSDPTT